MPGLPSKVDAQVPSHSLYEGIQYTEFWDGSQKQILDQLEHAVVRGMLPKTGRRILDVGCGYGRLSDCYLDRFQQAILVDGSMSLLRQAYKKTGGQAIYIAADAARLPFRKASFDVVLMIRVFHHLPDSRACLAEMHDLLCRDGRLVFSYRNKKNMMKAVKWLLGKEKENPFSIEPAGVGTTLISHHPKAVDQMLRGAGFSHSQVCGVGVWDWIASRIGYLRRSTNVGVSLAPLFGRSEIAPWILCSTEVKENEGLIEAARISDLLQCPACGGAVCADPEGYACQGCQRCFPVKDGIIDMRV